MERSYGTIRRAFTMPDDASADGIKATYRDGVLEVTVAKKPESKPTRIKVNVETSTRKRLARRAISARCALSLIHSDS